MCPLFQMYPVPREIPKVRTWYFYLLRNLIFYFLGQTYLHRYGTRYLGAHQSLTKLLCYILTFYRLFFMWCILKLSWKIILLLRILKKNTVLPESAFPPSGKVLSLLQFLFFCTMWDRSQWLLAACFIVCVSPNYTLHTCFQRCWHSYCERPTCQICLNQAKAVWMSG